MAQLPADRTKLAQAQGNMTPTFTASSQKLKDALTEAYDTVDMLNQKVNDHGAAATLPHADKSVTRAKLADKVIGAGQLDDAAVGQSHHQDNGIPGRALPDNVILQRHMSDNSVGSPEIQAGAVTASKIPNGTINSQHIDAALLASSASLATQAEFDKRGVNIEKYGAKGDWNGTTGTDDTIAIQAAIDSLKTTGGIITATQNAKYKVKSLKFYSNIIFDLNGATLAVDTTDVDYNEAIFVSEGWLDAAKTTNDAIIRNGTLDCGNRANYGVFVHRANRVKVYHCTIKNVLKGGVRFNNDTTECQALFNNIFLPIDNPFGTITAAVGVYCISATVDSEGGGRNDTLTFTEATNLSQKHLIQGNNIYDGTHGIHLFGAQRCRVIGNFTARTTHRGIILSPVSHLNDIIGNVCEEFKSTGIHLAWGCNWNNIVGNVCTTQVSDYEGNGIKMYYGCKFNHVAANLVRGTKYAAYRISMGSQGNSMVGNKATDSATGYEIESYINANSDYWNVAIYQPATPPATDNCTLVGNYSAGCITGIRFAQRGNPELKRCKIGDNHVSGAVNGVIFVEETANRNNTNNVTGNSIQGSSTANWTLPRGTDHCTEFSGNAGFNFIRQGSMVLWYDTNLLIRTAASHPNTDPNTQGAVMTIGKSGTTANRPATPALYVGMPYFDSTLGKMIWVKQVSPAIWVDATGTTV